MDMANTQQNSAPGERIPTNPIVVVEEIGQLGRNFFREVGSMFWFIAHTFEETIERIRRGRFPFRATSFFRHTERAGVDSVPLVGLVSFFLGLTMALLTGYQLQRFGTERLIPGLVAISFTRELGPLITGIMLAFARVAGETAPLLFTALGNQFWNLSPNQPIAALPLQIYVYANSPYEDWHRQAWAGALVLVTGVFCVNVIVRILTRGHAASVV